MKVSERRRDPALAARRRDAPTGSERRRTGAPATEPASRARPQDQTADPFEFRPADAPLRPRRRPKLIAAGVLAVCLGGLGGAALYSAVATEQPVIVVTRDLTRGQVVAPGDLGVVELNAPPGVSVVAATEIDALVGQRARQDLTAGAVLASGAVGADLIPPGSSAVGLRLAPGRIPGDGLKPGERVSLIPVQPDAGTPDEAIGDVQAVSAVLATSPTLAPDQSAWLVDVHVATADARLVSELAATDRLALVLEASR